METITEFKKISPGTTIFVKEVRPKQIPALLYDNPQTIGLGAVVEQSKKDFSQALIQYELSAYFLYRDQFICFVSKSSPLAQRKFINVSDIYVDNNNYLPAGKRQHVDRNLIQAFYKTENMIGVGTLGGIKKLVAENAGIAVIPQIVTYNDYYVRAGMLVPLFFCDNTIYVNHYLLRNKNRMLSVQEEAFIQTLKTVYARISGH